MENSKVVIEFKAGMSPSSKTIFYKFLFWVMFLISTSLITLLMVEYFKFGYEREVVIVNKNLETAAYDLFDKQFTRLLTVGSMLVGVFGILIPFITFLIQRETLKDERYRIMKDICAHEKQLIDQIEMLKREVNSRSIMLKAEVSEQVNALNLQIEKFTEDKKHFYNELAYKFGMHLYLSGNVCAPDSVSKPMLWVYALEQFSNYPGYKDSSAMLDSILANLYQFVDSQEKGCKGLGIHWRYRRDALMILRRINENRNIKMYLRNAARDISIKIFKIETLGVKQD